MAITRRNLLLNVGALSLASKLPLEMFAEQPAPASGFPQKAAFTIPSDVICLNNARWHPTPTGAVRLVQKYLDMKARDAFEAEDFITGIQTEPRKLFAQMINAKPTEIAYVSSTTIAENLVVNGLGLPGSGGNVVTDYLHFMGSVYHYQALARQGLDVRFVRPRDGRIDLHDLEKVIDSKTKLVALSLVSNVNGFQPDLKAVCDMAHAHGALVYADVIQAAGAVPVDVRASNVDFAACSGYKWLMGDMGIGFLYVREDLLGRTIRRTQYGFRQISHLDYHLFPLDAPGEDAVEWTQGQAAGHYFEVGTYANTTLAHLAYSLQYIHDLGVEKIQAHTQALLAKIRAGMTARGYEALTPEGSRSPIVTYVVKNPEELEARLEKRKVDVGITGHRMRIAPSVYNDENDVDRLLAALA